MKNRETSEEQIQRIYNLIGEGNKRIVPENEAILILGSTGVGKSTLTYLLAGEELISKKTDENNFVYVAKKQLGDIVIATNEYASQTVIPNKWKAHDGTAIWDCPGFEDTEGIVQEIVNSFNTYLLSNNINKIKIILVISEHSLHGKAKEFVDTLNNFSKMFKDVEQIKESITLVVSHASHTKTVENIQLTLTKLAQQNNLLSETSKKVMEYVKNTIFMFHAPERENEVYSNPTLLESIKEVTNYFEVKEPFANVAISEKSLETAFELFDTSNTILVNSLTQLAGMVLEKCNNINNPPNQSTAQKEETFLETPFIDLFKSFTENINLVKSRIGNTFFGKDSYHLIKEDTPISFYKELLDLDDICALEQTCKELMQPQVELLSLLSNVDSIFRILNKNTDEWIYEEIQKNIHEKIKYVQFLELVCEGKKRVDISALTNIFKEVQSALEQAADKGIKIINISPNEDSYKYYEKIVNYLDTPKYKEDEHCKETKAKALYYMGNIAFKGGFYSLSIENYVEAIGYNIKCTGFEDIYQKMVDIFYIEPETFKQITDAKIKEKLFYISQQRFFKELEKITLQIIDTFQEEIALDPTSTPLDNKVPLHSHLEYLNYLNKINKFLNEVKILSIINNKDDILTKVNNALEDIQWEYFKKNSAPLVSTSEQFNTSIKAILFFNELIDNSKNAEIDKWFDKMQEVHFAVKRNYVKSIKNIHIDDDLKDPDEANLAKDYLSKLKNSKEAILTNAKAFLILGNIYKEKGEFDKALENYEQALELNNGLNIARKYMAKIKEKLELYSEASKLYETILDYTSAARCLDKAIEKNPKDSKFWEEKGDYLSSLYLDQAKACYIEAITLESKTRVKTFETTLTEAMDNRIKSLWVKFYELSKPEYAANNIETYRQIVSGEKNLFPQTAILGDSDDLFDE